MFSRLVHGESRRAKRLRKIDAAIERAARVLGDASILARTLAPWRYRPRASEDANPVVLVHGFGCDVGSLGMLARCLAFDGWRVLPLDLDTVTRSVESLAERLARHVERVRRRLGCRRVDLVGHSLGGLIIRYYVQMLDGHESVDRVVTIGTPHAGGTLASYAVYPLRMLGYLPKPRAHEVHSADQLMPGSEFYEHLNGPVYRVENCARVDLTNVWSLADECVVPSWRARFPLAARERRFLVFGHVGLVVSGSVAAIVRDALRATPRPPLHLIAAMASEPAVRVATPPEGILIETAARRR